MHGSMAHQLQCPTLVLGNFTTNCWRDYSGPRHEQAGIREKRNTGRAYPVASIDE
jgi:hypothetical protein